MKKINKRMKSDFADGQGKHQKAKQNHLNTKQPKGNKGNNKWEDFDDDLDEDY